MAESSNIAWTKSTFNPWIGCTKVGPGCDNCYAESQDARKIFQGETHWGSGVSRMRTSASNWNQVRRWNKQAPDTEFAGRHGYWPVFSASLADVFDNEVPDEWRNDFWALVRECKNLTFLIVTKRIGNARRMLPEDWGAGYQNVHLIITVTDQTEADRDIPKLLSTPAAKRGLSMEPLLGPVDLSRHLWKCCGCPEPGHPGDGWTTPPDPPTCCNCPEPAELHWIIVGGESGANARPMHPDWARSLRDQCKSAGASFFFKQWGEWMPTPIKPVRNEYVGGGIFLLPCGKCGNQGDWWDGNATAMDKVGTKASGRLIDGHLHDEHHTRGNTDGIS